MSSRLLAATTVTRRSLGHTGDPEVRLWWNNCLLPSIPRPACRCIHSLSRSVPNRRGVESSTTRLLRSFHPLSVVSPKPLVAAVHRRFSTPSLASSTSESSLPPPSFSTSSASSSASLPSSSPSSPDLSDAVHLTDAAAARIGQLRAKHGKGMKLRLSVDSGGCSGLSYKFEMDQQGRQSDDCEFRQGEGAVLVDAVSLSLLKGSLIDFTQRIERSGFEVVNNPNSAAKCGCGSSFQPKHF